SQFSIDAQQILVALGETPSEIASEEAYTTYSPRLRRSNARNFDGDNMVTDLPFTDTSFCTRNLASVREKVSLTVPNSAANTRLVVLSSMVVGLSESGFGQRLINQFASRVSTSLSVMSSS